MPRTVRDQGIVVLQVYNIDLTSDPVDVALDMMCPGDGAFVLDWSVQVSTAGVGAAANHEMVLEHGTGAAGVALTAQLDLDADAVAGTIVTGDGLGRPATGGTTQGTKIQIQNAESASITTGAIVDVMVRWQL